MKRLLLFISIIILFSSCARKYQPILLEQYSYYSTCTLIDSVNISYAYDIQKKAGNLPHVRKEKKYDMALVGLRIDNKSKHPITLTRYNFIVTNDEGEKIPTLTEWVYAGDVAQSTGQFFFNYSVAGLATTRWDKKNKHLVWNYNFLPMIIGSANGIYAIFVNNKHVRDLTKNIVYGRTIMPGETVFLCLPLDVEGKPHLNFQYIPMKQSFEMNTNNEIIIKP